LLEKPNDGFKPVSHIVLCPQMFPDLPKDYYAFQMEQTVNPRWFDKSYYKRLKSARAVFDYSMTNLAFFEQKGFDWKKFYYLPITADLKGKDCAPAMTEGNDHDVVFYGDDNNPRRKRFLEALKKHFNVKVINNQFGEALYSEIRKAKLIVNIHYYDNALLETTRIAEALSLGALVVSESSPDITDYPDFSDVVDFVPVDDVEAMVERVRFWLRENESRAQKKSLIQDLLRKSPDMMEFYFLRFLLAEEAIDFKTFYARCARHVNLTDFVCLGLPEVQSRRRDFLKLGRGDIQYFSGLRHQKGWMGCALSYKFLMMSAKDLGFEQITVCEDDVEFPPDWDQKISFVRQYLAERVESWHIFNGLMAVIHKDIKVKKVFDFNAMMFVHVDRMMSMVFNIYSKKVFDVFAAWDQSDTESDSNTIDKFIERQPNLEVVTTRPFLVGHRPELASTLWGIGNKQYDPMIAKSGRDLSRKVDEFQKGSFV
jgi:hypothetical protein